MSAWVWCRLRVVPLSLSPSCGTRKKTARKKWQRELLETRKNAHLIPRGHVYLAARRTKRKRDHALSRFDTNTYLSTSSLLMNVTLRFCYPYARLVYTHLRCFVFILFVYSHATLWSGSARATEKRGKTSPFILFPHDEPARRLRSRTEIMAQNKGLYWPGMRWRW